MYDKLIPEVQQELDDQLEWINADVPYGVRDEIAAMILRGNVAAGVDLLEKAKRMAYAWERCMKCEVGDDNAVDDFYRETEFLSSVLEDYIRIKSSTPPAHPTSPSGNPSRPH